MKLNQILTKTIDAATAADLDTAVATFISGVGEATLLSVHYSIAVGVFSVMIVYTN